RGLVLGCEGTRTRRPLRADARRCVDGTPREDSSRPFMNRESTSLAVEPSLAGDARHASTPPAELPVRRVPCRVVVLQPALPHYRRAFLQRLGERVDALTVAHGERPLSGEEAASAGVLEGVSTLAVPHRPLGPAFWMPALWQAAGDDRYDVAVFGWNVR